MPVGTIRIAIEAGVKLGWEKWLYENGGSSSKVSFVGMNSFGASGPVQDIFNHFKINVEEVCKRVDSLI